MSIFCGFLFECIIFIDSCALLLVHRDIFTVIVVSRSFIYSRNSVKMQRPLHSCTRVLCVTLCIVFWTSGDTPPFHSYAWPNSSHDQNPNESTAGESLNSINVAQKPRR